MLLNPDALVHAEIQRRLELADAQPWRRPLRPARPRRPWRAWWRRPRAPLAAAGRWQWRPTS